MITITTTVMLEIKFHTMFLFRFYSVLMASLSLLTWNATGLMSSSVYLSDLLQKNNIDVCGVSETWLYPWDGHFVNSIHTNYYGVSSSTYQSQYLNPCARMVRKGGVALVWKKSLNASVRVLDTNDERIIGISLQYENGSCCFIFKMYFPSSGHRYEEFIEYIEKLHDIVNFYSMQGNIYIMGDLNVHLNGTAFIKPLDRRGYALQDFLNVHDYISAGTLPLTTGALTTLVSYSMQSQSLIDHILILAYTIGKIISCKILDDDCINVSNHRDLLC